MKSRQFIFWQNLAVASFLAALVVPVTASNGRYQIKWQSVSAGGRSGISPSYKANVDMGSPVVGTGESPSFRVRYEIAETTEDLLPTGVRPRPELSPKPVNYLDSSYPNPFNPTATIRYGLAERGHVSLRVYNVRGQLIKTLVDEVKEAGSIHTIVWDGRNNRGEPAASGVYFYQLATRGFVTAKKMVLLK